MSCCAQCRRGAQCRLVAQHRRCTQYGRSVIEEPLQQSRRFTRRCCNILHKAVAVLSGKTGVKGVVRFLTRGVKTRVLYNITGLKDGLHGFHIHECGDLTKGCASGCNHFNPDDNNHGGRTSLEHHAGDMGNIRSRNGKSSGSFTTNSISVDPVTRNSVVGRMVIVHADEDDLGKGNNNESVKTGNAGERLACGVIGITI